MVLSNGIKRLRAYSTIIIILYHCSCPYMTWCWADVENELFIKRLLYTFFFRIISDTMLPTFFLISGIIFYGRKSAYSDRKYALWKKFDRLIVPYCLIACAIAALSLERIGAANADGHLWFIFDLFIFFCIALLFYKVNETILFLGGAFLYVLTIFMTHQMDSLGLSFISKYLVFFLGGYCVVRYFTILRESRLLKFLIAIIYAIIVICDERDILPFAFNMLLISLISDSEVKSKFLNVIDEHSYSLYLIHHPLIFLLFMSPFLQRFYANNGVIAIMTLFVLVFSSSLLLSIGFKKIGFKYF